MRSQRWGLVAAVAVIMAAALLAIVLIWRGGPEPSVSATTTIASQTSPSPAASRTPLPTPTPPVTYSVQAGDTLSAIAEEHDVTLEELTTVNDLEDPDVLHIGQILIIPGKDDEVPPDEAPTQAFVEPPSSSEGSGELPPTITPSGPPLVGITRVEGVGDLESEILVLSNQGGTVSLEGWALSGPAGEGFVFPALTLFSEGEVRVHSAAGENTPRDLYWGRTEAAWEDGQLVTLRDAGGNVVDTHIVSD